MENFNYQKRSLDEIKASVMGAKLRLETTRSRNMTMHADNPSSVVSRVSTLSKERKDTPMVKPEKVKTKSLGLADISKEEAKLLKKMTDAGLDLNSSKISGKDLERRIKENERDLGLKNGKDDPKKQKDQKKQKEDEKNNNPTKQKEMAVQMIAHVSLPSGMRIHQEGPRWVIASADGKAKRDVTELMDEIDKFNQSVDIANKKNSLKNNVQSNADKAAAKGQKEGFSTNANLKSKGTQPKMTNETPVITTEQKVAAVEQALPAKKDIDGKSIIDPKDMKALAQFAIKLSDKKLREKMGNEEKKTNKKADDKAVKEAISQALYDKIKEDR